MRYHGNKQEINVVVSKKIYNVYAFRKKPWDYHHRHLTFGRLTGRKFLLTRKLHILIVYYKNIVYNWLPQFRLGLKLVHVNKWFSRAKKKTKNNTFSNIWEWLDIFPCVDWSIVCTCPDRLCPFRVTLPCYENQCHFGCIHFGYIYTEWAEHIL